LAYVLATGTRISDEPNAVTLIEDERLAAPKVSAPSSFEKDCSAAKCISCVDSSLDRRGLVACAIPDGAEIRCFE